MQPWRTSVGLTTALAGSAALLVPPRLECLAPLWPLIITDHGLGIASHLALVLGAVAAALYAVARAAGLADLGRRVDLIERSVRRGEGDPELTDSLRRDAEGEWE